MENKILKLAKQLIAIESTRNKIDKLAEVLDVTKKELPEFRYKEYTSNGVPSLLFYNTKIFPKQFKLILDAHLDVVPGSPEQYKPKVVGDKLYGRGTYDMKTAATVEILLFKELANKVNYPLGLQLVTDEEVGGFNCAKYQTEMGIKTECIFAGECSSNFNIGISAKGIIWLDITFTGKNAHAAYLWEGDNALFQINQFLNKLWKQYPIPKTSVWKTTINVSTIKTSNTTNNKVPGDATLSLDIRYISGDDKTTLKTIKSFLPKNAKVEIKTYEPSRNTQVDNSYVKILQSSIKKFLGYKAQVVGVNGGSDLRHYPKSAGIEFGPIGNGPHTDNEWVSIKSLNTYYEILKDFVLNLDK